MLQLRITRTFQFSSDILRQHFAELDAPLVERVDVPNYALGENNMFIECHERTQRGGREAFSQKGV